MYKVKYETPVDVKTGDGEYYETVQSYRIIEIGAKTIEYHDGMVEFRKSDNLLVSIPQSRIIYIKSQK